MKKVIFAISLFLCSAIFISCAQNQKLSPVYLNAEKIIISTENSKTSVIASFGEDSFLSMEYENGLKAETDGKTCEFSYNKTKFVNCSENLDAIKIHKTLSKINNSINNKKAIKTQNYDGVSVYEISDQTEKISFSSDSLTGKIIKIENISDGIYISRD